MGINNLADIFKENYYKNMEGGILEALEYSSRKTSESMPIRSNENSLTVIRNNLVKATTLKLASLEGSIVNVENLVVAENLRNLYKYIRENGFLECVNQFDRENMRFFARGVFDKIMQREDGWKDQLPPSVSNLIEEKISGTMKKLAKKCRSLLSEIEIRINHSMIRCPERKMFVSNLWAFRN